MKKNSSTLAFLSIVIGVVTSGVLGVLLAAVALAARPVVKVSKLPPPKKRVAHQVYLVQGRLSGVSADLWLRQEQAVKSAQPGDVAITEEQINRWFGSTFARQSGKAKIKLLGYEADPHLPVFRIHDGKLQISMTLDLVKGKSRFPLIIQTMGHFVRTAGGYSFAPDASYIGSCPVPTSTGLVKELVARYVQALPIPKDVAAGWTKARKITVDGSELHVTYAAN